MIRVLVVDDQHLVRSGVRMLCESAEDIEVVGEAGSGREVPQLVEQLCPDVVLMDLRMPVVDGIEATRRVLAARPASRIVVLTTFDDDENLYLALAAGAAGFLVKDSPPAELLEAIRRAAAGEATFSAPVLRRIVRQAVSTHDRLPDPVTPAVDVSALTPREREVLAMVGAGLSNADIANRLHLGVTTVKTHVASLMRKTASANRIRLAVLAARAGISQE